MPWRHTKFLRRSATIAPLAIFVWTTSGAWPSDSSIARVDQRDAATAPQNIPRKQIDETLAARLYNEAPNAWARLRERMMTQRGSYSKSQSGAGVGWAPRSRRADFAIDGENMKAAFQRDGVDVVFATNEDYAFSISRRAGESNASYSIQWLEERGTNPEVEAEIKDQSEDHCQNANVAWYFLGRLFSEWFGEPGFTVHGVAPENASGEGLVRVDFSYAPPPSTVTHIKFPSAYALFDPANHWIIRECEFYRGWGSTHIIYEYGKPVDGFPMLTKSRSFTKGKDGATMEVAVVIHELTDEPTPAEEFRLPFYGLPEPNFERSWYGWWLVYLIGGAACLTAAYAFRRRRRAVG